MGTNVAARIYALHTAKANYFAVNFKRKTALEIS